MVDNEMKKCNQCMFARICHEECVAICEDGGEKEHEFLIYQFEEETEKLRKQIKQESDARKRFVEEVKKLKQQLAEKDDELLQKEKKIQDLMLCEFVATTLDFNKLSADNCRLREQLAEHNQDKISFAVEQLEKMKELLYPELRFDYSLYLRVMHEIDNQIKQLKEGE
jgi:hypothetical protein